MSLTFSYVSIRVLINLVFDTCPAFWRSEVKAFTPIQSVIGHKTSEQCYKFRGFSHDMARSFQTNCYRFIVG